MTPEDLLARHSVIAADTVAFIYFLEDVRPPADRLQPFFDAWEAGSHQGVTSAVTLLELLVHPFRQGRADAAEDYRVGLGTYPGLRILPLDEDIAVSAARLRADRNLSVPDAIQAATALAAKATLLLTNDRRLRGIPGLETVQIDDLSA